MGVSAAELVTDRPDRTESSVVVPAGTVQLEAGWARTEDREAGAEAVLTEVPATLVRIGMHPRWELRIGWAGLVSEVVRTAGASRSEVDGTGDGELGAKIHLLPEAGWRPEMALLVATTLPIGDDKLSGDAFDPSLRLSCAHTLSDRVGLGYNLGIAWSTEGVAPERHRLSDLLYTVAVGFELSERWGAFTELFGEVAGSGATSPRHSVDGGVTYLLRPRVQLDLAAGLGLSEAAADWFVGAGLSIRGPR
jgi:hypothetical protein